MQAKQKSRITYQTLVKETTILPDLGSLFSSAFLSQLFTPRKRLRPKQEIVIRKTILVYIIIVVIIVMFFYSHQKVKHSSKSRFIEVKIFQ